MLEEVLVHRMYVLLLSAVFFQNDFHSNTCLDFTQELYLRYAQQCMHICISITPHKCTQVHIYMHSAHKFMEVYILEICAQMHVGLQTLNHLICACRYIRVLEICVEMKAPKIVRYCFKTLNKACP